MTLWFLAVFPCLLLFSHQGLCVQRINCQWGPYGDWSQCDGCTKLQTRSRPMAVYAQFGGNPCNGGRTETRACETKQGCPLEDGCGNRFRCLSGKCISMSQVCNGDQDCEEDGLDERQCDDKFITCAVSQPPPNIEHLGLGYDAVSGKQRGIVINTKSFGGQCHLLNSGVHNTVFRLPLSIIKYQTMVTVQNDISDEMFTSTWHYAKDTVSRETVTGTTKGYRNYDFHQTIEEIKHHNLLVLKNSIDVTHFQSNSPNSIPLSEEFWKALTRLPSVYDYAAYRKVIERFGTHYVSEGSLGGSFKVVASIDEETKKETKTETLDHQERTRTKRWVLIFPVYHTSYKKDQYSRPVNREHFQRSQIKKVDVEGGGVEHIEALKTMNINNAERNWEMYSNWADSLRSFPQVTKQKIRPLSELVKEVQCAGVKKLYLQKAIDQYLAESDSCHCRPCSNNGMTIMDRDECKCICKPGTLGLGCEQGTEAEGQPGVIQGSWSCWSGWSSCSGNKRSRSRSCSNPSPQNGGQFCIGEASETSDCEDQELQYLRTMEPQCFDFTLPPSQHCGAPPALVNGYVLDPKDIYLVGSRVEYTCTPGLYLIGEPLECKADLTWSAKPGLCTTSSCKIDALAEGVRAYPKKEFYHLGETVSFSCSPGHELKGEKEVTCEAGLYLRFSADPKFFRCVEVAPPTASSVQCEPWQKVSKGKCVCKMPFECGSSLELCVNLNRDGIPSRVINVCKMHALQCLGGNITIAEDSTCTWPPRNDVHCNSCDMWETCDAQTNRCRCKDSANCTTPGTNVCVRVGNDITAAGQTMSECEAGFKRCKGEKVTVLSLLPCTS
ncbi:complement component C7 [Cynoglossus semilaevis]|nr:complement component C7 [Cynoglossus semilaevis]